MSTKCVLVHWDSDNPTAVDAGIVTTTFVERGGFKALRVMGESFGTIINENATTPKDRIWYEWVQPNEDHEAIAAKIGESLTHLPAERSLDDPAELTDHVEFDHEREIATANSHEWLRGSHERMHATSDHWDHTHDEAEYRVPVNLFVKAKTEKDALAAILPVLQARFGVENVMTDEGPYLHKEKL